MSALAVVGLAAVLAGCGSSATPTKAPASGHALLAAYNATVGAGTAQVTVDETVTTPAKTVSLSGTGEVDFTSGHDDLTLTLPGEGSVEVRTLLPEVYIQAPAVFGSLLPAGKTWASLNIDSVTQSALGASLSDLSDSSQQSTTSLSYLEAVSGNGVTTVGPATIRGVPTTEYRAAIDLTKVGQLKDPAGRSALQKLAGELHSTSLPVTVWLDAQGRVAQESYSVSVPGPTGTVSTSATVGYSDFGSPVSISAPAASEVYDITSQVVGGASATS